jgi:hypothetical protein
MYAYVDETGNTGAGLFDKAQPLFVTAALLTRPDWAPRSRFFSITSIGSKCLKSISRRRGGCATTLRSGGNRRCAPTLKATLPRRPHRPDLGGASASEQVGGGYE